MTGTTRTRFLLIAALSTAFLFLGQAFLGDSKAEDKADAKVTTEEAGGVVIQKEEGPAGHSTIGIDEESLKDKEQRLTFKTLMNWEYEVDAETTVPDTVKGLDGQKVRLTGFMYPLQEGKDIQYFCLLRTTQTCCYGPRPQYNQYVFVEMATPTPFHRLDPVTCVGKIYIDPNPDEGFIYRMEGNSCASIAGENAE